MSVFKSRRECILATIKDMVIDLIYYNRKEDELLPVGQIEEATKAGEISLDEMVEAFRVNLSQCLKI